MENVSANPLSEDITAQVASKLVDMKEVSFHFRTTDVPDEAKAGQVDPETKKPFVKEWKRPTFKYQVPTITAAGLIAALQAGDKTTELIVDATNDVIINRMRGLIGEKIDGDASLTLSP